MRFALPRTMAALILRAFCLVALATICLLTPCSANAEPIAIANVERAEALNFEKDVLPILQRNCLACHSASERQGELVLESPDAMRKGGDTGPALIPGRGADSLLLKLAAHQAEPSMPPPGNDVNAKPLTPEELGLLRLWIDQGARGSRGAASLSPKAWQSLPSRISPVYSLDLTEDGQYLVASRANQLFLYHVPTGRLVTRLSDPALEDSRGAPSPAGIAHRDLIQSVALNLDGDLLASGSFREVKLWRRPSDVQLLNLAADAPLTAGAVSADRQWIATADATYAIQLWNASTGERGAKLTGHADKITSLRFTHDERLISASIDQSVRFWNVADGSLTGLMETPAPVNAVEVTFTPAAVEGQATPSTLVVSGGPDKLLRTWTLPQAAPEKWDAVPNALTHATVSLDKRHVAMACSDNLLRVLQRGDDNAFTPLAEWKLDGGAAIAMTFVTEPTATGPTATGPTATGPTATGPTATGPTATGAMPRLATTGSDGSISLWSLPNHKLLAKWRGSLVSATAIAASHDGKQLATGAENGAMTLWNLTAETPPALVENAGAPVSVFALSPSRSLLAIAGVANGKPVILVRNLDNGQLTQTLLGHDAAIRSLAFAKDNSRLVSGSDDRTIRVWNLGNAQQQNKLEGLTASVTAVAFSPDAGQVISGTVDKAVRLWNLADNMPLQDFAGHAGPILGVGFAANVPFSISADKSVRFWNPADGKQTRTFNDQAGTKAWTLSPNGQQLALAADDKNIRLYQLANGQLQQTLTGHTAEVVSLAYAADGKRLVTTAVVAGQPSESIVWDLAVNPPRMQEMLLQADVTAALFDKQADRILAGDRQGAVKPFLLRFARYLDGNTQPIRELAFHSNGQTLFTAAQDGSLRGYTTSNGRQTFATSHGAAITALTLSPNEQVLATAGENSVVRLWQTNGRGFGPQQLTGLSGPARSVSFSADGTQVLAGGAGDKPSVTVFDLQKGAPLQRFTLHQQPVVAFAVTGQPTETPRPADQILSIAPDSAWQWTTHAVRTITGHGADVTSLAQMPEAPRQILSGSTDSTMRQWNLESGQQIRQFNHGGPVLAVAARPAGQRVASVSENHTAKLWNVNGQQIAEMRGDVRLKTQVARLTRQQTASTTRVNIAKQRADAAEKDVPVKTAAEKKAAETLAAASKDVTDKQVAVDKAQAAKIATEKVAIEVAAAARTAVVAKTTAEDSLKLAQAAVPIAQQRAAQLAAAANAAATNEALKALAAEAQQAVTAAQQRVQRSQAALKAPTQAAQAAITKANAAAQKVTTVQKPYNDALAAMKIATTAQNLASQQHVIAARELKFAQDLVPVMKQAFTASEADLAETKKQLEAATKVSADAELAIRSVSFSPDGSLLLTGGDFPSVHTWDAEKGTAVGAYAGHTGALAAVGFLDDERLVSIGADQSLRVWQRNPAWRLERTIGAVDRPDVIADRVMTLDFSADASQLLVGGGVPSRNGELQIFNAADGVRSLYLPQAHDDVIHCALFSPDGKRIVSAGGDKYLRTFDIASSQMLRRFEGHTNYVLGVAWKGDGQTLASSSADKTVKIWDAETADQRRTITNFNKHVTQVTFVGETDQIVSSSGDRTVRRHNSVNGGNVRSFGGADGWLHCIDMIADGSVLAAGTDKGTVVIWNGNNGQQLRTLTIGR